MNSFIANVVAFCQLLYWWDEMGWDESWYMYKHNIMNLPQSDGWVHIYAAVADDGDDESESRRVDWNGVISVQLSHT